MKESLIQYLTQEHVFVNNENKYNAQLFTDYREASVLFLLYKHKNEWCFPVIQRHDYEGFHSKQIALPGGKKEIGETNEQTALRETFEEIGVEEHLITIIKQLPELYIDISRFRINPFIGYATEKLQFIPDKKEVETIHYISMTQFLQTPLSKIEVEELPYKVDGYIINNIKIWGATAHILTQIQFLIKKWYLS